MYFVQCQQQWPISNGLPCKKQGRSKYIFEMSPGSKCKDIIWYFLNGQEDWNVPLSVFHCLVHASLNHSILHVYSFGRK